MIQGEWQWMHGSKKEHFFPKNETIALCRSWMRVVPGKESTYVPPEKERCKKCVKAGARV